MVKTLPSGIVRNFKFETFIVSLLESIATIQSATLTKLHLLVIAVEQQLKHIMVNRYTLLTMK